MKRLEAQEGRIGGQRVRRAFRTSAEELREEGREEGREDQARATLVRQLRIKFRRIPRSARERLERASLSQLERWLDHVIEARTLGELLGTAPRNGASRRSGRSRGASGS